MACLLLGAGPATKPSVAPKADANNTVLENKTYHFDLQIPKSWKIGESSDNGTFYRIPGPAGEGAGGLFVVQVGKPKDPNAGLIDVVDGKKKTLVEKSKDVKFTKDVETKLDGAPAWLLHYDIPAVAKETLIINGKPGPAKDVVVIQRCKEIMCLKDGEVIDVLYLGEQSQYDLRTRLIDKVMGTFYWTDKPADDKK